MTSGYNCGLPFAPRRRLARLIDVSPAHGSLLVFSRRFGPLRFPSDPPARHAQADRCQHRRGARPVPALRQRGRAAVGRRHGPHRRADALRRAVRAGGREGRDRHLHRAAALRHGVAVGEQGDRHRAALRPRAGAPHRARRRVHGHAEGRPARRQEGALARGARRGGRRAARPHDRKRGRRARGRAPPVRRAAGQAAGPRRRAGPGPRRAGEGQRRAGPGPGRGRDRLPGRRLRRSWGATRPTSS